MASRVFDLRGGKNLWHAPDVVTSFGLWLEGVPSKDQQSRMRHEVERQRHLWRPSAAADIQLRDITEAVTGQRIVIWNDVPDIIAMLGEEEGPYPVEAVCRTVETRHDETGTLQAYLLLEDPHCTENRWGYDGRKTFLVPAQAPNQFWVNLATIYQIKIP